MRKPSDVDLNETFPPIVGTLGRSEREAAASLIVRACQVRGDAWQPLKPADIGEVLRADIAAGVEPFHSLNRNPFFRPDIRELVTQGFARFVGAGDEKRDPPVELTEKGIAALFQCRKLVEASSGGRRGYVRCGLEHRHRGDCEPESKHSAGTGPRSADAGPTQVPRSGAAPDTSGPR